MQTPYKGKTGARRILQATRHSMAGLRAAYREEAAFRQEVWICLPAVLAAPYFGRTWGEAVLLAGSAVLVLIVELLNSSVESAVDRVSTDWHVLAKRAKDMASAAVLTSLVLFGGIWITAVVRNVTERGP